MRVNMVGSYGAFEKGKSYDVSDTLGKVLIAHKWAVEDKPNAETSPATKNMKADQVRRGGLDA